MEVKSVHSAVSEEDAARVEKSLDSGRVAKETVKKAAKKTTRKATKKTTKKAARGGAAKKI